MAPQHDRRPSRQQASEGGRVTIRFQANRRAVFDDSFGPTVKRIWCRLELLAMSFIRRLNQSLAQRVRLAPHWRRQILSLNR
jgi:hypothetical protein